MNDWLNGYGIQPSIIVAGFLGGVVRAITMGKTTFRQAVASPISGCACAMYLTKPVVHYLRSLGIPLPPESPDDATLLAVAFIVGICGMRVANYVMELVGRQFKIKFNQDNPNGSDPS